MKLWGDSLWSDGYYRQVGAITAEAVGCYVQNSQKKHCTKFDDSTKRSGRKAQPGSRISRLNAFRSR